MTDAWIAAIVALVSLGVGSLVSLYTIRRQVTASLVSASRQQWINSLRETVAEFLAVTSQLRFMVATDAQGDLRKAPGIERTVFLLSKVALLSNPKEEDHKRLVVLLGEAQSLTACLQDRDAVRRATELHHEITDVTQVILKREWERVKMGEPAVQWGKLLRRGA